MGAEVEDLGADVRVQPHQLQAVVGERLLDSLAGRAALDRKAELRVELAGGDVFVGVRAHAGREPDLGPQAPARRHHLAQHLELLEAVHHQGDARRPGRRQILAALVVAQEVDALGG